MVKSIRVNLEDISCSSSSPSLPNIGSLSPLFLWDFCAAGSASVYCVWLHIELEKRKTSTEQTRESSAQKVALLSVRVSSQNIESRVSHAGLCAKHCTTRKRDEAEKEQTSAASQHCTACAVVGLNWRFFLIYEMNGERSFVDWETKETAEVGFVHDFRDVQHKRN